MIKKDTFKALLIFLGFTQQKTHIYHKHFAVGDFDLCVDFKQELLIYPEEQGFTINERQTCDFEATENFVVFECVHRLFSKGYKPEHIELEPKWKVGHGASGGRADILVRNQQNAPLLFIECKTAGREFDKEWRNMQQDGGQLFSYLEQEKSVSYLCLYAIDFDEKTNNVTHFQRIIFVKDNKKILAEYPELKSFQIANNVKERFQVWKDTYQLEYTEAGIFEDNIQAYQIGKDKYTLDSDTKETEIIDIKGKYHQFRTILRKYNVSRRENAFEVLVNLFLCKLVDEIENPNDLKFYWKGIAYDSYFDLVDRLQALYKVGMQKFLEQEIVYVSNAEIDGAFWAFKQQPNVTKQEIKKLFHKLKYFHENAFAFISVRNEATFNKNVQILLDIIQMWQSLRLKTEAQNQFLGDMFEFFLDNGIKQSEGQFFTPIPICKFIVMALPLAEQIAASDEPLQVIDYACGAGHFLTEYAYQIKSLVAQHKRMALADYYRQVYGIEKEDRLAKVAKVSAFMYGYDEIQVLDADALASHPQISEGYFDVLVANPPFAVEDFLLTLHETERARFSLFDTVADLGNKNIQCFFLERAQQLLAGNGVMGVIVPSSVLSNSDAMHVKTREIILQYFDVVSLVELGSTTFGKTGTNTVVLFLRRKAHRPEPAAHFWERVQAFFQHWVTERATAGGAFLDVAVVQRYCQFMGLDFSAYESLLLGQPSAALLETALFQNYWADFEASAAVKQWQKSRQFLALSEDAQQAALSARFLAYLQAIEQQKLYYFILTFEQSVLVVKSPPEAKAKKAFLGYEWSGAKGSEGIRYFGGATVHEIKTPMFDPLDRDNPAKLCFWIRQHFIGAAVHLPTELQALATQVRLVDLLDFSRVDFNQAISLTAQNSVEIDTRWELVKLGDVVNILIGGTPSRQIQRYFKGDNLWVSVSEMNGNTIFDTKEKITDEGIRNSNVKLIPKGTALLSFKLSIGKTAIAGKDLYTNEAIAALIPKKNNLQQTQIINSYLFYLFSAEIIDLSTGNNAIGQSLNSKFLKEQLKIPLPPLSIQKQIAAECETVDLAVSEAHEVVLAGKVEIEKQATELFSMFNLKKLGSVCEKPQYGANEPAIEGNPEKDFRYIRITDVKSDGSLNNEFKTVANVENKYLLKEGDFLFARSGNTVGKTFLYRKKYGNAIYAGYLIRFRPKKELLLPEFLNFVTQSLNYKEWINNNQRGASQPNINGQMYASFEVPIPPLTEQKALVANLETIEQRLQKAQQQIDQAPVQKQAILKKYL